MSGVVISIHLSWIEGQACQGNKPLVECRAVGRLQRARVRHFCERLEYVSCKPVTRAPHDTLGVRRIR